MIINGRRLPGNRVSTSLIRAPVVPKTAFDIVLAIGDSYMSSIYGRDYTIDIDWPQVWQYRQWGSDLYYRTIDSDITPFSVPNSANTGLSLLSPAEYFGKTYAERTGKDILIINRGWPSTRLTSAGTAWAVGASSHEASITETNLAIAAAQAINPSSQFVGIIQWLGTNDAAAAADRTDFHDKLVASITDFRSRITGASGSWYLMAGLLPDYYSVILSSRGPIEFALRDVHRDVSNSYFIPSPTGYIDTAGTNLHPLATGNRAIPPLWDAALADSVAATINTASTFSSYEGSPLSLELKADKYVTWSLTGTNAASFEIFEETAYYSSTLGVRYFLRFVGNANGTAGTYNVTLNGKTSGGQVTTKAVTITVPAAYGGSSTGAVTKAMSQNRLTYANQFVGSTSAIARYSVTVGAGLNIIEISTNNPIATIKINGVSATRIAGAASDFRTMWSVPIAQAGTYNCDVTAVTGGTTFTGMGISVLTLTNTVASPGSVDAVAPVSAGSISSASLTVNTGGIMISMGQGRTGDSINSPATFIVSPNNTYFWASRDTTGIITLSGASQVRSIISASFDKAP